MQSLALNPTENGDHGQVDDDSDHRDLERSTHGQNDVSPCLQLTHRMIEMKVQGHLSITHGQSISSSLCGSDCLINVDVHVDQQEAHQ